MQTLRIVLTTISWITSIIGCATIFTFISYRRHKKKMLGKMDKELESVKKNIDKLKGVNFFKTDGKGNLYV